MRGSGDDLTHEDHGNHGNLFSEDIQEHIYRIIRGREEDELNSPYMKSILVVTWILWLPIYEKPI